MKHGDFTNLATQYINRPDYNIELIKAILKYGDFNLQKHIKVADVGAGTGKLTKQLLELNLDVTAVEPNDSMRSEGIKYTSDYNINWLAGSGENTCLDSNSFDWVLMASSFHWTDPNKSLPEFHRILKKDGIFTAIWNPRDINSSELHSKIESKIYEISPNIKRVSSGSSSFTDNLFKIMVSTGHFKDVIFMEMPYEITMTKERYMGAWYSVNDIRVQAGEENWKKILDAIENEIKHLDNVIVPYKIKSWTAKKVN